MDHHHDLKLVASVDHIKHWYKHSSLGRHTRKDQSLHQVPPLRSHKHFLLQSINHLDKPYQAYLKQVLQTGATALGSEGRGWVRRVRGCRRTPQGPRSWCSRARQGVYM